MSTAKDKMIERLAALLFEADEYPADWHHARVDQVKDYEGIAAVDVDAHRAEVLREAATAIESSDYDPGAVEPVNVSAAVFADLLRRMADGESA